jgi:hypothetical protein
MNLHEGIMSADARLRVATVFNKNEVSFNKYALTKLLIQYKLMSGFQNYDEWITNTFIPLNRFTNDTRI